MNNWRSTVSGFLPGRRQATARSGHTVIEMVIVTVIIAAIAGIAAPRLNYPAMRLDANVRIVRSTLQQAWRSSIQRQHDILVSFDTAAHRIRVLEDADNDAVADSGERAMWRPLQDGARFDVPNAGVNGSITEAVTGPGVRGVQSMPTITFHRNGSTSGDAEVYLSTRFRTAKEFRAITIAQPTGRTDWFRLVNSNWWRSGGI